MGKSTITGHFQQLCLFTRDFPFSLVKSPLSRTFPMDLFGARGGNRSWSDLGQSLYSTKTFGPSSWNEPEENIGSWEMEHLLYIYIYCIYIYITIFNIQIQILYVIYIYTYYINCTFSCLELQLQLGILGPSILLTNGFSRNKPPGRTFSQS